MSAASVAVTAAVLAAGGGVSWLAGRRGAAGDPLRLAITRAAAAPPPLPASSRGTCPGTLVVHADGSSECHAGLGDCWDHRDNGHARVQPCYEQGHGCGRQCAALGATSTAPGPARVGPPQRRAVDLEVIGDPIPDPTHSGRQLVRVAVPGSPGTEFLTVLRTEGPGPVAVPPPARNRIPNEGVA